MACYELEKIEDGNAIYRHVGIVGSIEDAQAWIEGNNTVTLTKIYPIDNNGDSK